MKQRNVKVTHTAECPLCLRQFTHENEQEAIALARTCANQGKPKYLYAVRQELPWAYGRTVRVLKRRFVNNRGIHTNSYLVQRYDGKIKAGKAFWKVESALTAESRKKAQY